MDVKELRETRPADAKPKASPPKSRQREGSALATSKVSTLQADQVELSVDTTGAAKAEPDSRAKANDLINVINVASEATAEIEKIVKSIDGIVEQADGEPSTQRREILEVEANELVGEIRKKADLTANGVRPLGGDEIKFEIEQQLGRTLEVLLPDGAADAFGLGAISFTPKESIINVRASVAVARERIDGLRDAVDKAKEAVGSTVTALDVALQNQEASQASIRDVDQALKVASDTRAGIGSNPQNALGSVGKLNQQALNLLNS